METVFLVCRIQALGLSVVALTLGLGFHFLAGGNGGITCTAFPDWLEKTGRPRALTCFLPERSQGYP